MDGMDVPEASPVSLMLFETYMLITAAVELQNMGRFSSAYQYAEKVQSRLKLLGSSLTASADHLADNPLGVDKLTCAIGLGPMSATSAGHPCGGVGPEGNQSGVLQDSGGQQLRGNPATSEALNSFASLHTELTLGAQERGGLVGEHMGWTPALVPTEMPSSLNNSGRRVRIQPKLLQGAHRLPALMGGASTGMSPTATGHSHSTTTHPALTPEAAVPTVSQGPPAADFSGPSARQPTDTTPTLVFPVVSTGQHEALQAHRDNWAYAHHLGVASAAPCGSGLPGPIPDHPSPHSVHPLDDVAAVQANMLALMEEGEGSKFATCGSTGHLHVGQDHDCGLDNPGEVRGAYAANQGINLTDLGGYGGTMMRVNTGGSLSPSRECQQRMVPLKDRALVQTTVPAVPGVGISPRVSQAGPSKVQWGPRDEPEASEVAGLEQLQRFVDEPVRPLLASLGLLEYEAVLQDNAVDMAALKLLKREDLMSLGLPLGAAVKLVAGAALV